MAKHDVDVFFFSLFFFSSSPFLFSLRFAFRAFVVHVYIISPSGSLSPPLPLSLSLLRILDEMNQISSCYLFFLSCIFLFFFLGILPLSPFSFLLLLLFCLFPHLPFSTYTHG
jgi:hypothetical protein